VQRVDIGLGDVAQQMRLDVLQVFGFGTVDIARDVEVEFVFFDLAERYDFAVAWDFDLFVEYVDDFVDVHFPQAVFVAVFHEALAGVDHENALAVLRVFLVDDDDARRDAGAVKQVGGQADDALDQPLADEGCADGGFDIAAEQHAVRQNARAFATAFQRTDDVQQVGVIAVFIRRHAQSIESAETDRERYRHRCPSACR
jgi:hypothetical protein